MEKTSTGEHRPISWEDALGRIAEALGRLLARGEGHRIGFLAAESSELLMDLARHFTLAGGSKNFARMGQDGGLAYWLTQGLEGPPGFDLSRADLVLSFGLDLFEGGPAPMRAISALVGERENEALASLLHVGTRLSPSGAKAEQYVRIAPGTHGAFALGVAHVLVREGRIDREFVERRTFGFEDWTQDGSRRLGFRRLLLERYYPDRVGQLCGCDAGAVVRVARRFAEASRPLAVAGGEALGGSNATWNGIAVHALNALLGVFDRPGGVVLPPTIPLTPLPETANAGDLPESIFAPRDEEPVFGIDPCLALTERLREDPEGIEILFVAGADPIHESPAGKELAEVMDRIPLLVALTPLLDDTAARADLILPAHTYLEGWQSSSTPRSSSFSVLGLAPPVVEPLFDTRHPGDVLLELAQRVSDLEIPWAAYDEYLKYRLEGLAFSGQGSILSGAFEESWKHFLEERGWRFSEHAGLEGFWEELARQSGWWNPVPSPADWERMFPHESHRYEFFSTALEDRLIALGRSVSTDSATREEALQAAGRRLGMTVEGDELCLPHFEPPGETPEGALTLVSFRPITARGRLGAASPMLMEMFGYPVLSGWQTWAEMEPETAHGLGIEDGDQVSLETEAGKIEVAVHLRPGAAPGVVHVPLGLGRSSGAGAGIGANPVDLLTPVADPLSGRLSHSSTSARLRLIRRRPRGGPAPHHSGERV